MKRCSKCKKEKKLSEFYDKGKENRKAAYCKGCFNAYCIERWREKKRTAIQYKGGKCKECGYNKCQNALEFHHRKEEKKELTWNKMRLYGWDRMKKELDKCELLCSNCHREVHEIIGYR